MFIKQINHLSDIFLKLYLHHWVMHDLGARSFVYVGMCERIGVSYSCMYRIVYVNICISMYTMNMYVYVYKLYPIFIIM